MGSTLDGDVEESHAAVRVFQPFVVDLDVPRTLTEGDRMILLVPIRNYSDRMQRVHVEASGATLLEGPGAIAPAAFANALLDLRASKASPAAKLKVIAIGGTASDAIESLSRSIRMANDSNAPRPT
jgi:alpha-2-macroglobulin family protein